jgi:hypothetical protein
VLDVLGVVVLVVDVLDVVDVEVGAGSLVALLRTTSTSTTVSIAMTPAATPNSSPPRPSRGRRRVGGTTGSCAVVGPC